MAKEYKTMLAQLSKYGIILQEYNKYFFVSVQPVISMERVKWSIVRKGTNAKDQKSFYMTFEQMRQLCAEIDNLTAVKKINEDNGPYPEAYKFVTGNNGCKRLQIGKGQKGITINIQNMIENDKESCKPYSFALSGYTALQDMSFWFKAIAGLIHVEGYYAKCVNAFYEHEKNPQKNTVVDESDMIVHEDPADVDENSFTITSAIAPFNQANVKGCVFAVTSCQNQNRILKAMVTDTVADPASFTTGTVLKLYGNEKDGWLYVSSVA